MKKAIVKLSIKNNDCLLIILLINFNIYLYNKTIALQNFVLIISCDGGVMVSMVAFQAVDPGSIPGHRTFCFLFFFLSFYFNSFL